MKAMLSVSLGLAVSFAVTAASAADNVPAGDYRAAATEPAALAPLRPLAPDCRVERLSLIWGPDRQPGAYECYGRSR
jgi:hypothetical protein